MPRVVVVIGAGPVGCLAALALAKAGWDVQIFDARSAHQLLSSGEVSGGRRSINLAISARGMAALESVDPQMAARCLRNMLPMKGRYLHRSDGTEGKQMYDITGQCINSVDRGLLNRTLLEEINNHPRIHTFFQHKLVSADFDKRSITFEVVEADSTTTIKKQIDFNLCIGADGSYSNVRRQLMRVLRMNFQQEYIPHEYLELQIPAGRDSSGNPTFLLDPNFLHIWPRHSFMLVALPNMDKTFTCTLFAPTRILEELSDQARTVSWFRTQFPDIIPLIGEDKLLQDFLNNPRSALICIKAKPYHYKDRAVILGDAAHSMVPFFGQGLNCGFEDVRVLDIIMRSRSVDPSAVMGTTDVRLAEALEEYSETRHDDLIAISDMAMENYVEMRHSVTTPIYVLHKFIDNVLSRFTPHRAVEKRGGRADFPSSWAGGWLPLYTMVTFRSDLSYSAAKRQGEMQRGVLRVGMWMMGVGMVGIGVQQIMRRMTIKG